MDHTLRQTTPAEPSVGARIARDLGEAILAGRLAVGATLPGELDLASRYGASRTLVREALRSLAAKGLIAARKKAGTKVRPRSVWQLFDPDVLAWRLEAGPEVKLANDLLAMRVAVEPEAAAAAALRGDAAAIAAIAGAFAEMESTATDRARFADPDLRFHKAILAASGNEFMIAFGALIETALVVFLAVSMRHKAAPGPSVPLHGAILSAIQNGDADGAREAMRRLLARTSDNIAHNARPE